MYSTKSYISTPSDESAISVVDSWYAEAIADGRNEGLRCGVPTERVSSIDKMLCNQFPRLSRLAHKAKLIRGLLWFLSTRNARRVVCTFSSDGLLPFLALESIFYRGKPRVFLVEFLRPKPVGLKAKLKEALHTGLFSRIFPYTIAGIHVMTNWEIDYYSRKYRIPCWMFTYIPFPMMLQPSRLPENHAGSLNMVLASGRAACDWVTLFAAARGMSWRLTIVCSREDRAMVDSLNQDGRATVMSEISADEHDLLLRNASVYALVLRERGASAGQVRLARAIEAGIPVVATRIHGLEGYLEDGITGLAVPTGDEGALRAAINRLLADPQSYRNLRLRAYEAMRTRTLEAYVSQIKSFTLQASEPTFQ
jgi:glycosyltransferase involved in cell wall biosynthesis